MAYIPTEWETGDVITAAKLNNMEQGIEDAFVAPAVTIADEGDVLTVNSSGEWAAAAPASPLPEVTAADQGKVLTVDSSGDWAAESLTPTFIEVEYDTSTQVYVLPSGATPPAESVMTAPIKPIILAPLPDTELTTDMVAELHYVCHHKMMGADIYQFSASFNAQNVLYSATVTFAYMSGTFNTVNGWIMVVT